MERRKVSERVKTLSLYDLDGSIDDALARLEGLKKEFDGEELSLDVEEEYYDMLLVVYKVREETREEYEKRVRRTESRIRRSRM